MKSTARKLECISVNIFCVVWWTFIQVKDASSKSCREKRKMLCVHYPFVSVLQLFSYLNKRKWTHNYCAVVSFPDRLWLPATVGIENLLTSPDSCI